MHYIKVWDLHMRHDQVKSHKRGDKKKNCMLQGGKKYLADKRQIGKYVKYRHNRIADCKVKIEINIEE